MGWRAVRHVATGAAVRRWHAVLLAGLFFLGCGVRDVGAQPDRVPPRAGCESRLRLARRLLRRGLPMSFERWMVIAPAFDRIAEGYGRHGVEMTWYVRSEKGVIQFVLYTNWNLPHIQKEDDARNDPESRHLFCHPMPADIGYHSPVPMYEGQTYMTEKCSILGGDACYYDGSSLNAKKYYDILVAKGGDALWEALEAYYASMFEKGK